MNRKRLHTTLIGGGLLLLYACDATIHEYPHPVTTHVVVELNVDRSAPLYYKELTYGKDGVSEEKLLAEESAEPYTADERLAMRLVAEVHQGERDALRGSPSTHIVARREKIVARDMLPPQDTLHIELPDGDYTILTWADYVPAAEPADWHYQTASLTAISITEGHTPRVNHHKSAATGYTDFAVDRSTSQQGRTIIKCYSHESLARNTADEGYIPVYTNRPLGRYKIYATDIDEYVAAGGSLDEIQVQVTYRQYISNGYNVATQQPNSFIEASTFVTQPQLPVTRSGSQETPLAYDYVLVSTDKEDHIKADLFIYDKDGTEINHYQDIDIPLQRNKETVIRGPFLTLERGSGGISINEEFEGEHVVEVTY